MSHVEEEKKLASKSYIEPIYEELAKKIKDGDWYYTPRLIKGLADLDQAKICLECPASEEDIAKNLELDKEHVKKEVKELIKRGLLCRTEGLIKMPITVGVFIDFAGTTTYNDDRLDDEWYEMLGLRLREEDWVEGSATVFTTKQNEGAPMNRVVPRWKAIKDIPGVMPSEDIREILKPEDGKLSTSRCMCKQIWPRRNPAMFEGTHANEGHCFHFGNVADHYVKEMELGTFLSWEESMALIDNLEKSPIFHTAVNVRDTRMLCNCDNEACVLYGTLKRSKKYELKDGIAPSRFLSTIDTEKCKGSKICTTKCPFKAIRMTADEKHAHIDEKKCMGCGTCVINCPEEALSLKIVRPPEHIPEHGFHWVENFYLQPSKPETT